jgi:hypothetical protein
MGPTYAAMFLTAATTSRWMDVDPRRACLPPQGRVGVGSDLAPATDDVRARRLTVGSRLLALATAAVGAPRGRAIEARRGCRTKPSARTCAGLAVTAVEDAASRTLTGSCSARFALARLGARRVPPGGPRHDARSGRLRQRAPRAMRAMSRVAERRAEREIAAARP